MAIAERSAVTTWDGSLASGSGVVRPVSRLFAGAKVSVNAVIEPAP